MVLFRTLLITTLGLASCAHQQPDADRQVEWTVAREHSSCLAIGLPAPSLEHTECVLFRYNQRQRELERLRSAVAPIPSVTPEAERQLD